MEMESIFSSKSGHRFSCCHVAEHWENQKFPRRLGEDAHLVRHVAVHSRFYSSKDPIPDLLEVLTS